MIIFAIYILKAWKANQSIDFNFVNGHQKTYQVRDSSSKQTLFNRLRERLNDSKNLLLIITENTKLNNKWVLEYDINYAISNELIIIAVYPNIKYPISKPSELQYLWPQVLKEGIENQKAHVIHIPFDKNIIKGAINQFSNKVHPNGYVTPIT